MADPLIIYGATGYSGQVLTRALVERGLRPVVCGRNPSKLDALARQYGLPHRVALVSNPEALRDVFRDSRVVVNAAGPFSATAQPVVDACLAVGAHYVDITAEVPVISDLAARHAELQAGGIMAMPAIGFDVVPSDCLAAHLLKRLPHAERLAIAVTGLNFITRGSARTLLEAVDFGIMRRNGELRRVPLGAIERTFASPEGPRTCINVSLGDIATAFYSTGIPNIETYVDGTPLIRWMLASCRTFGPLLASEAMQTLLGTWVDMLPENPTPSGNGSANARMMVLAEAEAPDGTRARSALRTPEAYAFTGVTGSEIIHRILNGEVTPGFQTPSRVYGSDFVLGLEGVTRVDLP